MSDLEQYEKDLADHIAYCAKIEPKRLDFKTEQDFERAYSEWGMKRFMDAPNKPGYFRANND